MKQEFIKRISLGRDGVPAHLWFCRGCLMKLPFTNPWPHPEHRIRDILIWKLGLGPREPARLRAAPDHAAPWQPVASTQIAHPPATGWRALWLGHSSFLLQGSGVSLLIDPVFSRFLGPLPLPILRRRIPAPCAIEDLPPIDAVLLSHSHYDHLDLPTLRRLGWKVPLIVADGHAGWLRKKGFTQVTELAWLHSTTLSNNIRITATPAQHFSARSIRDRNRGHWCGWLVEGAGQSLWHAGDTGYCDAFREIGERFGPIDFGMIPIGAYQPRHIMRPMHMDPGEAVTAFIETRCRRAAAMHWGTFRLTDEPMGEPPLLLQHALREKNLPAASFTAGSVGQIWEIDGRTPT